MAILDIIILYIYIIIFDILTTNSLSQNVGANRVSNQMETVTITHLHVQTIRMTVQKLSFARTGKQRNAAVTT